tara:strand:+ start:184 stop:375 length:192 start_codon:yes stop_codon:yes gene_type:complete
VKVGDKVKFLRGKTDNWLQPFSDETGVIVEIDDTHKKTFVKVLVSSGIFRMWEKYVEVINESR